MYQFFLIILLLFIGFIGIYLVLLKGRYILSPATLFIYYNVFYPTGLYLAKNLYQGETYLFLLGNDDILQNLIISSIISLISFLFFYLNNNKSVFFDCYYVVRRKMLYPIMLILFIVLVSFGHKYGWHAITSSKETNLYTNLYAYIKYLFIVLSIFAVLNRNMNKKELFIIFIFNIIVMFIDGARTTFLGFLLGYLFVLYKKGTKFSLRTTFGILILVLLLPAVRALVMSSSFSSAFTESLIIESTFGGYTSLQGIYATQNSDMLLGLSYILDPLIYFLPADLRDNYLFFNQHVNLANLKGDEFAPLGGFYYIAETYSNFGILGGILIGGLYGFILKKIENCNKNMFLFSIIFISTFGATFAKQNFANEFKIFVLFLIFSFFIRKVFAYKTNLINN